jgi:hypothetical protein
MRRVPVLMLRGQISTTQQVIFSLVFLMFILGLMMARLDFSMRGEAQPEILAVMASSSINALSGMDAGRITMGFDRAWDITLARESLTFESGGSEGEAEILGWAADVEVSGAEKILIIKEEGRPLELTRAE